MLGLEETAHRLANYLTRDVQIDTRQKARIEYGLSLSLGVAIELVFTLGVAVLLGTALYTFLMMLSSLLLRVFIGGTHCSSYRRCLVFTMVIFIGLSIPAKYLSFPKGYLYLAAVLTGIVIQGILASPVGKRVVLASDRLMQKAGI